MDPFEIVQMAMGDDTCPRCQRPLSEYPTEVWAEGRGDQPTVLAHKLKYCQSMGWWNAHREQKKAEQKRKRRAGFLQSAVRFQRTPRAETERW